MLLVLQVFIVPVTAGMSISDIISKYTNGSYTWKSVGTCTGLTQLATNDYWGNGWWFNSTSWTTIGNYTINSSLVSNLIANAQVGDVITCGDGYHTAMITGKTSSTVSFLNASSKNGIYNATINSSNYDDWWPTSWPTMQLIRYNGSSSGGSSSGGGTTVVTNVTVTTTTAQNITDTNAVVYGTVSYSGTRPSECGVLFGTSPSNMTIVGKDTINHNKNPFDMWYDLNNNGVTLSPATTYYWQCYATVNGTIYYGRTQSFTTTGNTDPTGCVDAIVGDYGKIFLRGWTYDSDDAGAQLKVHVYIGGQAGDSNAECVTQDINGNEIIANTERTDVNDVYNCGAWHGFDVYVPTTKVGTQAVYVYAINNVSGNNPCIGSGTVNIPSDTEAPVISNVNVTNITKDGYTVYCDITDNVGIGRVQFPTWTLNETDGNTQDDLVWHTYSENVNSTSVRAWYRVKTSEHNNETGMYATHIYAWDKAGNKDVAYISDVDVELNYDYTPVDVFEYNGNLYAVYDDAMSYDEMVSLCEQMGGHIVTINDQAENDAIAKHLNGGFYYIGYSNTENKWSYGTSDYTNWNTGEPNNTDGVENLTVIFSNSGVWNDTRDEQYKYGVLEQTGFILEIEKSSIQLGSTKYFNNNKYEIYNTVMPYSVAKYYAESQGGHLLTITSDEETSFIKNSLKGDTWLALTDVDEEGKFVWTTQEDNSYTNWIEGEPNNSFNNEDYASVNTSGTWNDYRNQHGCYLVVEYDDVYTDSTSIYVSKKPDKTQYSIGEELDLSGGKISGNGRSGDMEWDIFDAPMTDSMFTIDSSEFNNQVEGEYKIYVTYNGATTSFSVTVGDSDSATTGSLLYGDVNTDNRITADDAATILQKTLNSSYRMSVQDKTDNWMKYADVSADGLISADDAATILQKTLNSAYKMPAEL